MEATTIQPLMDKHQRCIDILEAISCFEQRKKNLTENIIEGFYGAFPDLEKKYLNKIDTINRCIERLEQRYKSVMDESTKVSNVGRSEHIDRFTEWLADNHGIKIHDMIVADYKRYGD